MNEPAPLLQVGRALLRVPVLLLAERGVDELEYQWTLGDDAHAARKERAADYALQDRALPGTLDVEDEREDPGNEVTSNVTLTTVNVLLSNHRL